MQNEKFGNGTKDAVFVDAAATSENVFDGKKAESTTASTKIDTEKIAAVETGKLKQKLDNTQYVRIPRGEDYSVLIPVEEYLDKEAAKLGFESYAARRAEGLSIDVPPLVDRHSNPINMAENKSSSFLTVNSNAFETAQEKTKGQTDTIGKFHDSENKGTVFDIDMSREQIQKPTHTHLPAANIENKTEEIVVSKKDDSFTVSPTAQFQNTDTKSNTIFEGEKNASQKQTSHRTNAQGKEPDIYVYYDSKSKEKAGFNEQFPGMHDKQAIRQHGTDVGGGAVFTAHYSKNGTLVTDISLNKGKTRTETKGFIDKSLTFVDETQRFVSRMPKGDDGSFEEVMDSGASSTLEHLAGKALENKGRYKKIRKDVHKEVRELEKELREEKRQRTQKDIPVPESSPVHPQLPETENTVIEDKQSSYFTESQIYFTDDINRFSNPDENCFIEVSNNVDEQGFEYHSPKEDSLHVASASATTQETSIQLGEDTTALSVSGQFDTETGDRNGNGKNRSIESYFTDESSSGSSGASDGVSGRFMTKEERLEQAKSKEKAAKKSENKEIRKAATMAAVAKLFETRKNMAKEIGDMSGQGSGDLLKDGSGGLFKTFADTVKQVVSLGIKGIASMLFQVGGMLISVLAGPLILIFTVIIIINVLTAAVGGLLDWHSDSGDKTVEEEVEGEEEGEDYVTYLESEELWSIMDELYANYPLMSFEQETAVWYALDKVGCPYEQEHHTELVDEVFDASSLAYRAYWYVGVDISYEDNYSAAGMCETLIFMGREITKGVMKPGDLLFYGGSDNGRYAGIYHVAIYVGNIDGVDKMVEARNPDSGVVYCNVRDENLVAIARPCDELDPPEPEDAVE